MLKRDYLPPRIYQMIKFRNIVSGLAAAALANSAAAGALGPDGLDTAPACGEKSTKLEAAKKVGNDVPTGLTASNKNWRMEILADPKGGSWILVGESLKVRAQKGVVCELNSDIMGFPADINQEVSTKPTSLRCRPIKPS